MKIGFIGLGNVGGKLAESLLRNKFELTVRDVEKNVTENFKKKRSKNCKYCKRIGSKIRCDNYMSAFT
tara:strand:- start:155 stop:358 length:204 start_codon:yes stop_codon:yes gene_type:complete